MCNNFYIKIDLFIFARIYSRSTISRISTYLSLLNYNVGKLNISRKLFDKAACVSTPDETNLNTQI